MKHSWYMSFIQIMLWYSYTCVWLRFKLCCDIIAVHFNVNLVYFLTYLLQTYLCLCSRHYIIPPYAKPLLLRTTRKKGFPLFVLSLAMMHCPYIYTFHLRVFFIILVCLFHWRYMWKFLNIFHMLSYIHCMLV